MKVVDMHCDTISVLLERKRAGESATLRENTGHLDLKRMKEKGYLLQNFALYVNKEHCDDPWEEMLALYEVYQKQIAANTDIIAPVIKYNDIFTNESLGKMSAMLTVEEGAVCKGEVEKLRKLYEMGVRMLILTWNYPNELGYPHCGGIIAEQTGWQIDRAEAVPERIEQKVPCVDREKQSGVLFGLTERGKEFVTEMEQLGMLVDVSHLSDAGFYDVLECTRKPFVASHSNARSICGHSRNLTDDMLRKLGERGGCTGLNYYVNFLGEGISAVEKPGSIEAMVRHARHIVNVGGIEVLGLGSDFDGIDTNEALPGVQSIELLWNALHKAGFTENELDRIFYKNVLRVYQECLK